MLVLASFLGLAALGQTLALILGGLDLSIPGFIVMGAIVVSKLYSSGWPSAAAILVVIAIAAALGAATGWICHRWRIQPLIVTLGVGALVSGAAVAWTHGSPVGAAPTFLTDFTAPTSKTFGFLSVPPVVVIWLVVTLMAALRAKIRTQRVWVSVFALSAVASALVGVLLAGFAGADQAIGDPYLFTGLTAVIVGGTTFMGARGDYTHTVIGALFLTALTTVLLGKGADAADQQIVFGLLILIVVAGYGRDRRLRDRV
jgi:ribose transport system permease protein